MIPVEFNNLERYRAIYNGGGKNIFARDSELSRSRAIDEDTSTFPDALALAISRKLESANFSHSHQVKSL